MSATKETRRTVTLQELRRMGVARLDKLPQPAEFRVMVGKGKKQEVVRRRKQWIGFGWVDEGPADGTEPLVEQHAD